MTAWARSRTRSLETNPVDMGFDGRLAEEEVGGDLLVGQTARDSSKHVDLALGQGGQHRPRRLSWCGAAYEVLDETAGDARGQERVAGVNLPDGVHQPVGGSSLEQEPGCPGLESRVDVLLRIEGRQHEDPRSCPGVVEPAGRPDPVEPRHPDVHEDHVRVRLQAGRDRLVPIFGLTDDGYSGLALEDEPEAGAHERLVVGDDDPNGAGRARRRGHRTELTGIRASTR